MKTIQSLSNEELGRALRKLLAGTEARRGVDLDLLYKQKYELIARVEGENASGNNVDDLNGIINFLDALQDMCVDDLNIWSFPAVHLLMTRGGAACGGSGESDADIDCVTCDDCLKIHDEIVQDAMSGCEEED